MKQENIKITHLGDETMHYRLRKLRSFVSLEGIKPELETETDNLGRLKQPIVHVL
jgi:hypothetical protein